MIHQSDPRMAPDSDYEPGTLHHLVVGNDGRMLDRRRTPIRIVALKPGIGVWVCEVRAFEDAGARWELPFEAVDRYQFARGAARATDAEARRFRAAVRRFDRPLEIPRGRRGGAAIARRIAELRREAGRWLEERSRFFAEAGALDPASREGSPLLARDLEAFMRARGLWEIEDAFTTTYVSHPSSAEMVKAHCIAIAELGLAAFRGTIVRDPACLRPPWTPAARREHVLARLAFVREMFARARLEPVLYRAVAAEGPLERPRAASLVSATFSLEVAMSLFGPPDGGEAVLHRRRVPVERILMTYFETAAMNRRFKEAEAVLIADPGRPEF